MIQARLTSTRLPGKALLPVAGGSILIHLLNRLRRLPLPVILAVPKDEIDGFEAVKTDPSVILFGGCHQDVLDRYHQVAEKYSLKQLVRVTADNPLTSSRCLLLAMKEHRRRQADLTYVRGLPYGAGAEVISVPALGRAWKKAHTVYDREHVTAFLHRHPGHFRIETLLAPKNYRKNDLRVTVDTSADFERYKSWITAIGLEAGGYLSLKKVIHFNTLSPPLPSEAPSFREKQS